MAPQLELTRKESRKNCGQMKEALTLQASHVLNASWDYGVQYSATGGGFNTQVQLVVST